MAVRHITADTRDHIRRLADVLYEFLPLTTASKRALTFRTIFAESNVNHYLEGETKKRALQTAWEKVFRHHARLPRILIRKIVPAGGRLPPPQAQPAQAR